MGEEPLLNIQYSWSLYPPANPRTSTHHFSVPSLSLESSDLAGGAEAVRSGWKIGELVTLQEADGPRGDF